MTVSSSSSDAVSTATASLADLYNYLSYLAHKGQQTLPSLNDMLKRARALSKAGKTEQMEVLTIGLVSTAIVIVIGFVLHKMWNKDEDTFAKARANKQITLLDDIAAPKKTTDNRKEKEKQQKKKEEKKKKAAANSADSKEDKPAAPAAAPASPPAAKPESPNPVTTAPTKKEQPKPEEPKKKETAAEPVALKKEEATPLQTSPAPEQKKPAQANGDKKANKKTSANKQVEEIENEEEFVEAKTKKNKKTEKKEAAPAPSAAPETTAPRHLSLKDLDTNKVVARLSSIDEIEIEYIEYLNNFFHETAINASRADKEAAIAKGKADESARALEKTKGDVKRLEKEMEGSSRLTHELATKAAAAGSEAQELKSRLAAIEVEKEKLCRDVDAAKKAAAAVVIPVLPDNKEELEKLNSIPHYVYNRKMLLPLKDFIRVEGKGGKEKKKGRDEYVYKEFLPLASSLQPEYSGPPPSYQSSCGPFYPSQGACKHNHGYEGEQLPTLSSHANIGQDVCAFCYQYASPYAPRSDSYAEWMMKEIGEDVPFRKEVDWDAKSASARIADLEEQLKATKESVAKERKQLEQSVLLQKTHEDTALGQEVLLAESRQNAKAIGERLTGLEQEKKSLEARLVEANKHCDELKEHAKQREATHAADTLSLKTMIEELNKEVHRFEEAKKEQTEMVSKLAAKEAELIKKCAALEDAEKQISAIKKGSESSSSAAEAQIAALTKRVSELSAALQEEKAARAAAAEIVVPVAEQKKEDVEEVVQLQKSAYLDAAPPTGPSADAEKVAELEKEVARLQEKNTELRTMNHSMVDQMNVLEKRIVANGVAAPAASPAPSTSAPAAEEKGGKKNKKKGRADKKEEAVAPAAAAPKEEKRAEEEERVRAERRLMQAHIGKLIGGATLDEAADTQAYEKWLKAAGASIKEAQEKAKKTPAPAPVAAPAAPSVPASDEETDQLRTENNTLRDALFLVTEELRTIEQLKTDREEDYVRRIAELEKKHGKAPLLHLLGQLKLPYPTTTTTTYRTTTSTPRVVSRPAVYPPTTCDAEVAAAAEAELPQAGDCCGRVPTGSPEDTVPPPDYERVEGTDGGRLSTTKRRIVAEIRCCHAIRRQIAEVRSEMAALPTLTVPASGPVGTGAGAQAPTRPRGSPPTSQSEDDGSWEVVA